MKRRSILFSIVIILIFIGVPIQSQAKGGINLVRIVQWKGTATPVELPKGVGGGVVQAGTPCYEVEMVNPSTGWRIGTGYDCITNPGSLVVTGEGTVTTYYIFAFRGRGSIISHNRVVVRSSSDDDTFNPVPTGQDPVNLNFTHILGSLPTENTITGGTRRFKNASGKVRVSGGVSLANFPDTIEFDDLFVIDFD